MDSSDNLPVVVHTMPAALVRAQAQGRGSDSEPAGPSLSQILAIATAHWKASALIAVFVAVAAGFIAHALPRSYKATATLMVNYDVNDPLAGRDIPIALLGTYMATQAELMQSPVVLDKVIDRLDLTAKPELADGNRGGDATLHDWVLAQLQKTIDIEQGRAGSQLVYISAWARNAGLAADIANAIAETYREQHFQRTTGPASDRAKRYTEELADLKAKVAVAQDAITRLRQRTGAIDLDAKVDVEGDVLSGLEHKLLEVQNNRRSTQARVAVDPGSSGQALTSDLVRALQNQGAELNAKMARLRTVLGPQHPQVIELQSQIDANRESIAAALRSYSDAAQVDLSAARQEESQLQQAVGGQRHKILELRGVRDEAAKLQLELESAQSVYKRALDGYDQIMFASTGQDSNVSVISKARAPADPAKRKTLVILMLGVLGGLGLGLAGPFAYELLHRRVRCRDDVERDLGIPVLIEFGQAPRMSTAS